MSVIERADFPAEPPRRWPLLGEMLIARGLVSEAQVDAALDRQRTRGKRLGECLVELGYLTRPVLYRELADRAGVAYVDLQNHVPDLVLAALVPEEIARRFQALPIETRPGEIVVAMAKPEDLLELDDLAVITGCDIIPALADPEQLKEAINRAYVGGDIAESVKDAVEDLDDDDAREPVGDVVDGSIVRLVDALLEQAINDRASDLHIEASEDRVRLRVRVDGVLHDLSEAPPNLLRPMISRLKVMAELDITQTRVPQDGRFSISHNGFDVDVRVATLPSAHGETMVLRLLDNSVGIIALPGLGFRPAELQRYEPAFRAPQGAIIVSGPTGSGKSSTLYSTLAEINTPERSIVSVEDPVEYQLEGLKQIQINPPAGLTFPVALRSILRNDPDVIFIGEVRDGETAHIAAEASITGHLVFSTIHTTSAAAVPLRLTDMGVDPYLVASALTCVVSQRLARRMCAHCAIVDLAPDLTRLRALGCTDELLHGHQIRKAVGCDACHGTGYHGRFAIYEVMLINDAIRTAIYAGASTAEIQRLAVQDGMDTLRVAALRRLVEGDLTIDELARVVA